MEGWEEGEEGSRDGSKERGREGSMEVTVKGGGRSKKGDRVGEVREKE